MSSHKFVQTLKSIGYPDAHKLKPQELDYIFENAATLPFLNWFNNSIGADNVVSSQDLQEFKSLSESGTVLGQHQLNELLENVKIDGEHVEAQEDLESEVEQLKIAVEQARNKKKALVLRRQKLSVQQMKLHNKAVKMKELEAKAQKSLKKQVDMCTKQDVQLNRTLQELTSSVGALAEIYKRSPDKKKHPEVKSHFLSQLELAAFHDAEAKYSHDLTAFTKRHFFEGVSQMSGEGKAAEYALLDLKSPQKGTNVDSDKEKSFLEDCEELQRLQQLFPQLEVDRINALVNAKKAHSAVSEAASLLEKLKAGQFPSTIDEISNEKQIIQTEMNRLASEAEPLLASLPSLIKELGHLQGGEVLTGDYDLKLRRQEYFTSKQDQVISHLVSQRARAEFLSLLYELELRCHQETHILLGAVKQVLEGHHSTWTKRMEELQDSDLRKTRFQGHVLDARDTSTTSLFHLLGDSETEAGLICVPKHKVIEKAKHLHAQHTCAKALNQNMEDRYSSKVNQLENILKQTNEQLYAGSSTTSGEPMWTPIEIQEKLSSLTASMAALRKNVSNIMSDVEKKRNILKVNVLQKKERDLFVLFHTNPEQFEDIVNTFVERWKAQAIK